TEEGRSDFPSEKILEMFGDNIPAVFQILLKAESEILYNRKTANENEYLLKISNRSAKKNVLISYLAICWNPKFKSVEMTVYRNMVPEFVPEQEFRCKLLDGGVAAIYQGPSQFDRDLHIRIEELAKALMKNEKYFSSEARQRIGDLFGGNKSAILNQENLPYYVSAIKRFILRIILHAANGKKIKTKQQLCDAIDKFLAADNETWNTIPVKEFQDAEVAHESNKQFSNSPIVFPPYR
ncbi:unnamed protein product, partial [marine sediment metagenome]